MVGKRKVDPFIINENYNILKGVVQNVPPSRISNIGETSFCLDLSRIKVVGKRGKATHKATSGSGRENITVVLSGNAVGEKLPPLIFYKGKNVWDSWLAKRRGISRNDIFCHKKMDGLFQKQFSQGYNSDRSFLFTMGITLMLTSLWSRGQEKII